MLQRTFTLLFFGLLLGCGEARMNPAPESAVQKEARQEDGVRRVAMAEGEKKPAPAGNAPAAPAAEKPTPRKIIYTGLADLVVDDFGKAEQQLRELVEEKEGYLADSQIHNQPGSPRSGTWTVRVPQKHFDAFMQAIVKFGEVRSRTTNSQDITDAYHDKAARLKADETEEKSLLGLLEKTQGKVEDILRVREQLRIVRGQIEEEKSQLQRWDKDVDLATVTVKLLHRRDYTPPLMPDFGSTVGRTFQGSIDALVLFGKGIVLTVVALAPWLVVLGLLGAPGFVIWRRRRAANAQVPSATLVNTAGEAPASGSD
ncbi:MAG TPA: DUF4349 domain-containing protein [Gemmataceae bacterium]|nr:DUF4349 domain-containing protein [Gemmataceae bacterium]